MNAAAQHYTGAQGREYHLGKRGIPPQAFDWIARLRAEKIQPHVGAGDVVFEYGVGSAWNLALLQCREKIGCDVTDFLQQEVTARGVRFISNTAALNDSTADRIICHHTLEHVLAPPDVLAELKRILKPDGKLLLYVPFEKERRYRTFDPAEPNHHLYSWNVQTLGNLVTDCGWTVENAALGQFGYDRFAAKHAVRFKLGEPGFRLIRALVHLVQPGLEVRLVARPAPQA